ncbi:histidine kinase, partial [Hansschlegelia beijingensis]
EVVALAAHELATNALKHGALAVPDGRLDVRWRLIPSSDGPLLSMEWCERGVSFPSGPPPGSGFGRELIEQGLPYELGAATSLEFDVEGLRATIQFPLGHGDEGEQDA